MDIKDENKGDDEIGKKVRALVTKFQVEISMGIVP